jgi:ribokinase
MQANKKICILGSANADVFVYVHHIPLPGETIQAVNHLFSNGGKGANQAVAAARLLGHSLFLGQVGNDKEMLRLKKEMSESGVELGWTVKEDSTTG